MTARDDVLDRPVHAGGADRRFGELTVDDVRAHAAELRSAAGWGPTARIATVAQAWRELADEMAQAGAATVADLGADARGGAGRAPVGRAARRQPAALSARRRHMLAPMRRPARSAALAALITITRR